MDRDRIQELSRKVDEAHGLSRVQKQHKAGKMTAWERIELLMDRDSFVETNMLLEHRCNYFGLEKKKTEGDGVITGYGKVEGRVVCVYAQDFTVLGGSISEMNARKVADIQEKAMHMEVPIVGLFDSGGARVQEGIQALSGHGVIFKNNVKASGRIPQISAIMGTCAGGASYSPALTDFLIMVDKTSSMFITGPKVVKEAIGEEVTLAELGGANVHARISGMADKVVADDQECIEFIKTLLRFLPDNYKRHPQRVLFNYNKYREKDVRTVLPESNRRVFDVRDLISLIVDRDSGCEIKTDFARNIVTMFARIGGFPIGIVANQSLYKAGCLDIDASDKASRFIRICDSFNIPLLNLIDVPGFLPGKEQEQRGIIRHGAKMLYAYGEAECLKITVILRKGYGGAYLAMCSKELGADIVFAWPESEMAVMGSKAAIEVLYKKATGDEKERLIREYEQQFLNPYEAAHMGYVDEVIEPNSTREHIRRVLDNYYILRPAGRGYPHGNSPV